MDLKDRWEKASKEDITSRWNNAAIVARAVADTTPITREELGGIDPSRITHSEEEGMITPTKEQLYRRERSKKFKSGEHVPIEEQAQAFDDAQGGGGFLNRMGEGVKVTSKGKAEYIQATNGTSQNPAVQANGQAYTYNKGTGQYSPYNPEGFDLGDVGEAIGAGIGGIANVVGSVMAPGAASNPLVQGGLSAVGELGKQQVSRLLPGDDALTAREGAGMAAQAAVLGLGTQGAFNVGAKVIDYARPSNIIARRTIEAENTSASQKGSGLQERLKNSTGENVFFTVGEKTQDPWLLGLQLNAEQSFAGKRMALKLYNERLDQAGKITGQLVDDLSKGGTKSDQILGDWAEAKFKSAVNETYEAAYKQAEVDYAFLKDSSIGKQQVPISNFWNKLEELKGEFSNVRTTIKKGELQIGKTNIRDGIDTQTLAELIDNRRVLSKVARGKGQLFSGLDPQHEQYIGRELVEAIEKDIAGAKEYVGVDVKPLLDRANLNYRNNMDIVRAQKNTVLGKLLKTDTEKSGESITQKLLKAQPSELDAVFRIGGFDDPFFVNSLKAQYAQELLQAGKKGARMLPPASAKWNPATVVQTSKEEAPGFNMVFRTPAERQAYEDVVDLNHRLAQFMPNPMPGFKPAQEAGEIGSLAGGTISSGLTSLLTFGPKVITKWFSGLSSARMIFNKEGQEALRTLRTTKPGTKAYSAAIAYIGERTMMEPSDSEVAEHLPEGE